MYGGIGGKAPRIRKLRTACGRTARFTLGPLSSRIFSGDKEIIDSLAFVLCTLTISKNDVTIEYGVSP